MEVLGIKTSLINKRERYVVKDKTDYNKLNCILVDSLIRFRTTCYKILLLDHLDLGTTTALHTTLGVPLSAMDIISSSVAFEPKRPKNHGLFYSGQLSTFVDEHAETRVYDAAILDFCCVWKPEVADILYTMLENRMLADMSVVSFTFSNRDNTHPTEFLKENKMQARKDLYKIFGSYRYHL